MVRREDRKYEWWFFVVNTASRSLRHKFQGVQAGKRKLRQLDLTAALIR